MASMKLSFTFILLLSGLVVFGEISRTAARGVAGCHEPCVEAAYITCDNYPGKQMKGCVCECAPQKGVNCALHLLRSGSTVNCTAQVQRLD
ncbi:hypothetical protein PR202_gb11061 [Eleusine coracana subsp. coracana]|uniref:Uncharacterized protein n=1 Tax=Eleusine coracana subsp. coracana TaxID=191504 RepID=A0AAV5CDV1_ELECO|nr:hypothetical protein QOZ80_3BG0262690 [Eleusine coracana subsp. coracana]KAK3149438.1 hypothetical protein QOZ80_3AG0217370 [Eleusine coracana subsp. coracana]GJM96517.1 hypothetical protein PR202_ga13359 [Eleusine coracana subsp. coracana]GJN23413.1 hypothetical protein PR202_gb11061 [Eleusine coracana subsp. coracana]